MTFTNECTKRQFETRMCAALKENVYMLIAKYFILLLHFLGTLHSGNQIERASCSVRVNEVNNDMKLKGEKSFCSFL